MAVGSEKADFAFFLTFHQTSIYIACYELLLCKEVSTYHFDDNSVGVGQGAVRPVEPVATKMHMRPEHRNMAKAHPLNGGRRLSAAEKASAGWTRQQSPISLVNSLKS